MASLMFCAFFLGIMFGLMSSMVLSRQLTRYHMSRFLGNELKTSWDLANNKEPIWFVINKPKKKIPYWLKVVKNE